MPKRKYEPNAYAKENHRIARLYGLRANKNYTLFEPKDCHLSVTGIRLHITAIGFPMRNPGDIDPVEKKAVLTSLLSGMYKTMLQVRGNEFFDVLYDFADAMTTHRRNLYLHDLVFIEFHEIFSEFMATLAQECIEGIDLMRHFMWSKDMHKKVRDLVTTKIKSGLLPATNSWGQRLYEGTARTPRKILFDNFEYDHFKALQLADTVPNSLTLSTEYGIERQPLEAAGLRLGNHQFKFSCKHSCPGQLDAPMRVFFTLDMERMMASLARLSAVTILNQVRMATGKNQDQVEKEYQLADTVIMVYKDHSLSLEEVQALGLSEIMTNRLRMFDKRSCMVRFDEVMRVEFVQLNGQATRVNIG